jgi:hypothetical protein
VQMEHVGAAGTGPREQIDPGGDEPLITGIVDGGKDAIGRTRAILVGRWEGNRRNQWLRARKRRRVSERMDVDPGEEARRVGRLAPPSQRARGQRQPPAAVGSARASARATCAEPPRGKKKSAETTNPRAAGAPPPRSRCCPHAKSPATRTARFSSFGRAAARGSVAVDDTDGRERIGRRARVRSNATRQRLARGSCPLPAWKQRCTTA